MYNADFILSFLRFLYSLIYGGKNQSLKNTLRRLQWIRLLTWWVNIFSFAVQKMQHFPGIWASSPHLCRVLSHSQLSPHCAACLGNFSWCPPIPAFFRSVEWGRSGGVNRVIACDPSFFPFAKAASCKEANLGSGGRQMGIKSWLCQLLAVWYWQVSWSL